MDQIANINANEDSNTANDAFRESAAADSELSAWSQISIFEELSQLNDSQSEKLQRLLEMDSAGAVGKEE
jgi:hypothetical protein